MLNDQKPNKTASGQEIRPLDPWVGKFIEDRTIYVLRNRYDKRAVEVSFSPDGFKFTTDKSGRILIYQNAYLQSDLRVTGNTRPSNRVVIEKFIPHNKPTASLQRSEFTRINKALKLLTMQPNDIFVPVETVRVGNKRYRTTASDSRASDTQFSDN